MPPLHLLSRSGRASYRVPGQQIRQLHHRFEKLGLVQGELEPQNISSARYVTSFSSARDVAAPIAFERAITPR